MRVLFYQQLSPFCRTVRLVLAEKKLEFALEIEKVWERRETFLALNPAGEVPVLLQEDGTALADTVAICEYLDECHPEPPLIPGEPTARAEMRRLVGWFNGRFWDEVTRHLVEEKLYRRFVGGGGPDTSAIRAGIANIHHHLDYIAYLTDARKWLAGDQLSLADFSAAAHLSCLDYMDHVPWAEHEGAKDWYARIKSRPSFRPLLTDAVPGIAAPAHYAELDF